MVFVMLMLFGTRAICLLWLPLLGPSAFVCPDLRTSFAAL
jgi:hypothetical protein